MKITIISGSPGSGKTSLARLLSEGDEQGVHIESDMFFRFLSHRLDPSLPDAQAQNQTVIHAYIAATAEYAAGGYNVYLDGVIGPWLLPSIASVFPDFDYVLLHAPINEVLSRAKARQTQPSASPDVIRRMHKQFSEILGAYRKYVIETNGKTIQQVVDEFLSRRTRGAFAYEYA